MAYEQDLHEAFAQQRELRLRAKQALRERAHHYRRSGLRPSEIARLLGVSAATVGRILGAA